MENLQDKNKDCLKNDVAESVEIEMDIEKKLKESDVQANKADARSEVAAESVAPAGMDASGEVNMEASITADDVVRAGGFGARDDISSFLPVASDSTDFEASLRDARDYEEPQGEICRPGLGWTGARE